MTTFKIYRVSTRGGKMRIISEMVEACDKGYGFSARTPGGGNLYYRLHDGWRRDAKSAVAFTIREHRKAQTRAEKEMKHHEDLWSRANNLWHSLAV